MNKAGTAAGDGVNKTGTVAGDDVNQAGTVAGKGVNQASTVAGEVVNEQKRPWITLFLQHDDLKSIWDYQCPINLVVLQKIK